MLSAPSSIANSSATTLRPAFAAPARWRRSRTRSPASASIRSRPASVATSITPASDTTRSSPNSTRTPSTPDGRVIVHHEGDLLTAGPGCPTQPDKALLLRKSPDVPRLGGLGLGVLEDDVVAEALQLADRAAGDLLGLPALEEVGAEVGVELAAGQQRVNDLQLRVRDGDDGTLMATSATDSPVLGLQVAVLAGRAQRGLHQRGAQPRAALGRASVLAVARTFVVARAQPGPRGQVTAARKAAHVGADLGDHDLGRAPLDPRDAQQPGHRGLGRLHGGHDALVGLSDRFVEVSRRARGSARPRTRDARGTWR